MSLDSDLRRLAAHVQSQAAARDDSTTAATRQEADRSISLAIATREPALGNPAVDGYVLSSTVAGVRSWVEQTGGGGGEPALGNPAADNYILSSSAAGVRLWVPRTSSATPQPLGTPAAGTTGEASDAGHVHAMPDAEDVGAVPVAGGAFTGAITAERLSVGTATGTATGQVRASGDILALDDPGGLFARGVNAYNVPTDHFTAFSGWTWAGTPFATPTTIDAAAYPSIVQLRDNSITNDCFAYQSGSDITVRAAVVTDSYIGVRVDDGTMDNSIELRVQAGAGVNTIEYRRVIGGAATNVTFFTGLVAQFWLLRAVRAGGAMSVRFGINAPLLGVLSALSASWTPTRAGITFGQRGLANDTNRVGFFDWALIA